LWQTADKLEKQQAVLGRTHKTLFPNIQTFIPTSLLLFMPFSVPNQLLYQMILQFLSQFFKSHTVPYIANQSSKQTPSLTASIS
jgi:hypothetical protein